MIIGILDDTQNGRNFWNEVLHTIGQVKLFVSSWAFTLTKKKHDFSMLPAVSTILNNDSASDGNSKAPGHRNFDDGE